MDLKEAWQKLNEEKLGADNRALSTARIMHSKHPVNKLKRAYLYSTIISVLFLAGFIVLFFFSEQTLVKVGMLCMVAAYIFFLATNYSTFKSIKTVFPVDRDIKSVLKHTHDFISANIRFQERSALFIYPVAAASGFLLGGAASGADVVVLLQKPVAIWALIGSVIVMTPLSWWLARWLFKVSYGSCLTQLKVLIEETEKAD